MDVFFLQPSDLSPLEISSFSAHNIVSRPPPPPPHPSCLDALPKIKPCHSSKHCQPAYYITTIYFIKNENTLQL